MRERERKREKEGGNLPPFRGGQGRAGDGAKGYVVDFWISFGGSRTRRMRRQVKNDTLLRSTGWRFFTKGPPRLHHRLGTIHGGGRGGQGSRWLVVGPPTHPVIMPNLIIVLWKMSPPRSGAKEAVAMDRRTQDWGGG
jgi:hypothetical protein